MSGEWTSDRWLEWLRRSDSDPLPSRHGINDCADALTKELARLRASIIKLEGERGAIPYRPNK
jgi:hypothetical protein